MSAHERAARLLRGLPGGIHEAVPFAARRSLRHRLGYYYNWEAGFDHHRTPDLEQGEEDGPPEFVGIGVQKAGTSWWYQLIIRHPSVSARPSIHKERHFFMRFGNQAFGPSDVADYHGWFPRVAGTITGEWTPDYFDCPWAPTLMAQAAPKAKLLVILRDPVERFRSGLTQQTQSEVDPIGGKQVRAFQRSLYASALRRWQSYFPADQLLVLQYEACVAQPAEQLARTYEFLGLDASYQPSNLRARINRTAGAKATLSADAGERLRAIMAPDAAELPSLVPTLDLSLWPTVTNRS